VHAKFSFVDLKDVAEAARIVLTEPNHLYAIYELAGTAPLSHVEVAEILSRLLSREVRAEREEMEMELRAPGLSEYAMQALSRCSSIMISGDWRATPTCCGGFCAANQHPLNR
jgi:uncharacterized protein YbjT (DUF2867 family)